MSRLFFFLFFFQHVLAVKMASVADTALNHHSLTHSGLTTGGGGGGGGIGAVST